MTCPRCREWFGSLEFHCTNCCLTFNTMVGFDRHRIPVRGHAGRVHWWDDLDQPGVEQESWHVRCAS